MEKFVDSHCHILDPRLACRADEIAKSITDDGLLFIVEISADPKEARDALEFAQKHDNVYCTIGVHPQMAHEYDQEFERWAMSQSCNCCKSDGKIVAFGECGLDYHYTSDKKDLQKDVFIRQIKLADQLGLPLCVHTWDAFDDTIAVLIANKQYINNGILFHCFSEGGDQVEIAREHFDAYFAFGGGITHCKDGRSDSAIRAVPIDRMMLETDAPYLNPVANGGKKIINEPKNVKFIASYIANLLNIPLDDVARATTQNAKTFYKIH